jgi:hypothetical protein
MEETGTILTQVRLIHTGHGWINYPTNRMPKILRMLSSSQRQCHSNYWQCMKNNIKISMSRAAPTSFSNKIP